MGGTRTGTSTHGFRRVGGHPEFEFTIPLDPYHAHCIFSHFYERICGGHVFKDGDEVEIAFRAPDNESGNPEAGNQDSGNQGPDEECSKNGDFCVYKVKLVRVYYCFADVLRIVVADNEQKFTQDAYQISYCPAPIPARYSACKCTCERDGCEVL